MTTNQRKVNILYVCNASNKELNHRIKRIVHITDGRNYDNLAIEVFGPGRNFANQTVRKTALVALLISGPYVHP